MILNLTENGDYFISAQDLPSGPETGKHSAGREQKCQGDQFYTNLLLMKLKLLLMKLQITWIEKIRKSITKIAKICKSIHTFKFKKINFQIINSTN